MTRRSTPGKLKATRTKRTPGRSVGAKKPDVLANLVSASAQALALPIDPAWQAGVRLNLQLLFIHAALVDEFPLPDDSEPAPVFRA